MAPYTQNVPWQPPEKKCYGVHKFNGLRFFLIFFFIFIHSIHLSIQNEYIHDTYNLMYMQDTVLPCVIALTSLLPPRTQEISPSLSTDFPSLFSSRYSFFFSGDTGLAVFIRMM